MGDLHYSSKSSNCSRKSDHIMQWEEMVVIMSKRSYKPSAANIYGLFFFAEWLVFSVEEIVSLAELEHLSFLIIVSCWLFCKMQYVAN